MYGGVLRTEYTQKRTRYHIPYSVRNTEYSEQLFTIASCRRYYYVLRLILGYLALRTEQHGGTLLYG